MRVASLLPALAVVLALVVQPTMAGEREDMNRLKACVLDPGNMPGACAGAPLEGCPASGTCLRYSRAVSAETVFL